ncbi:unnamed protein product [Cuscuta campestris]|uniref:Uncharacterized protein n=1 Tax=Cuscuta campestris TaxID=132261 RepID=A0A484N5Z1_9ASTE|nr:unnamed protein product [Cuscuta campestris]
MYSADDVRDVKAIRETARGSMRRVINPIGRRICPRGGSQVVIVAAVHQRVPEHKERRSSRSRSFNHHQQQT